MGFTPCLPLDLPFSTGDLCETARLASGTLGLTCMCGMALQSLCHALSIGQLRICCTSETTRKEAQQCCTVHSQGFPHHCRQNRALRSASATAEHSEGTHLHYNGCSHASPLPVRTCWWGLPWMSCTPDTFSAAHRHPHGDLQEACSTGSSATAMCFCVCLPTLHTEQQGASGDSTASGMCKHVAHTSDMLLLSTCCLTSAWCCLHNLALSYAGVLQGQQRSQWGWLHIRLCGRWGSLWRSRLPVCAPGEV